MIVTGTSVLAALIGLYFLSTLSRRDKRLPPGPPTLPIIGNLHQIPTKRAHLTFTKWAKQYGGIFSLKVGPATWIVLTSPRLVRQLVDKKSSIYSHRPASYIGYNLISDGDHLLLMQYSDHWRTCRKLVHQFFMESMVTKNHIAVVNAEAVQMVRDLMLQPEGHMRHPKRFSNSIIMSLVYGMRTPTISTPHMMELYELTEEWSKVMEAGNTPPVDIFPFLKLIPESLLGNWRSRGQHVGNSMNALYNKWLEYVEERRRSRAPRDCFLDKVLTQQEKNGQADMSRHALYFLCGTLLEGGSDTTSSIIIAFIHAITKWPDVQRKAQAEIDAVVGSDRSPCWEDYTSLPYVAACVKETMRWRPNVPLGFPHVLSEDDTIDGMHLPKGSQIFINAFGMHQDESRLNNGGLEPDMDVFEPDRYAGVSALASELANGDYEKRDHYGYGAGRRLCPGIHLAERNLFLAFAKLLWAVNIEPGRDDSGCVIEPDVGNETAYSSGLLVCATDFPCVIKPRSDAHKATVLREFSIAKEQIFPMFDDPEA